MNPIRKKVKRSSDHLTVNLESNQLEQADHDKGDSHISMGIPVNE